MDRRVFLATAGVAAGQSLVEPKLALAQGTYPNRPVRLIIPFAPGGQTDILGRRFAQKLESAVGQSVVPENKGGAGGTIGSLEVVRAVPDGYTLEIGTSSTHAISPFIMGKQPYDPVKDFTPIALLGIIPMVVAVHPSVPARNLQELIALIKANPSKYAYGSAGVGSINHLTGEMFKTQAGGLELPHVPYKGSGTSVQDLIGGQIPILMASFSSVEAAQRMGRVRILAITMDKRSPIAPDVPTAVESGMPDLLSYTFNALFGPPAMPAATVAYLGDRSHKIMSDVAFQKDLQGLAIDPVTDSTPESTARFVREQVTRFVPIIKASGIQV